MAKTVSSSREGEVEIAAGPGLHLPWTERRSWFQARLQQQPPSGITPDEIEAHLAHMPRLYWERVNESDLRWSLEAIHGFLQLMSAPNVPPTQPFVSWRPCQSSRSTRVMICTWDRQGLLAKAVAAFSAVHLNIQKADVFTRADNVVLDVFAVTEPDGRQPASPGRLQDMSFLLEGALSEPPRFASIWACSRHKFLAPPGLFPPQILFDNESSATGTLVHIVAADRLGLLYDILQALAAGGLNVSSASIETEAHQAHDLIQVVDQQGGKLLDPARLEQLRSSLEAALAARE